jgi:hypothetical protein
MTHERLHELLGQVHQELERADSIDDESRELMFEVSDDIRYLLESGKARDEAEREGMSDRLDSLLLAFGSRHPRIAGMIEEVIDTLAKMGI